jgi:hypothetical protein
VDARTKRARSRAEKARITDRRAQLEHLDAAVLAAKARQQSGHWTLIWPSGLDDQARAIIEARLTSLAGAAAQLAGVEEHATREDHLQWWLHQIKDHCGAYFDEWGHELVRLFEASADLAFQANNDSFEFSPSRAPTSPIDDGRPPLPEKNGAGAPMHPNQAMAEAFLRRCNAEPQPHRRIIKADIWRAVPHKRARQFEYWQKGDTRATEQDDINFRRILKGDPKDFVASCLARDRRLAKNQHQ